MQDEGNNPASFAEDGHSAGAPIYSDGDVLAMPASAERVNSSPNVCDLSPAEKRRNKLGYHRTAVACGHCRRRKIRCMPAYDDTSGRCQNCIRLKKDCHFYPVDQNTNGQARHVLSMTNSAEGILNEADIPIPSSSPAALLRSGSFEHFDQMNGSLNTPPLSRTSPGYTGFHPDSRSMSGSDYTSSYDYRQHPGSQHHQQQQQFYPPYGHTSSGPWSPGFIAGSMTGNPGPTSRESTYEYQPSTPNGAYSWGPSSTRSMSMGEKEHLPHDFRPAYRTQTYPSIEHHQLPPTSAHFMPMSLENHPGAISNLPGPMSFHPMPVDTHHEWVAREQRTQVTGSSGAPTPVWYPQHTGLTDVGDDRLQPRILPSQGQSPR